MADEARTAGRAGTQADPVLTNVTVGDPLQRVTNTGSGVTGQAAIATGGTDRPNDPSDND